MRLRRRDLSALAALGLATGCAADGASNDQSGQNSPVPRAAPTIAVIPAEPEINAPSPAEVLGWSASQVAATFGAATLVRNERGAEIWQYKTDACVLFFFFYPNGDQSAVRHIDASGDTAMQPCVSAVVRQFVIGKTS